MKQVLLVCILLGALSACTGGGVFHKEKKYTPLWMYYNPLEPAEQLTSTVYSPEKDYPNYLNYPNDWVKHGLRGQVASVSYIGKTIVYFELSFDNEGKLVRKGSYLDAARRYMEVRDLKYNSMGKLEGVYRNIEWNRYGSSKQKFEYDASGKLIKREGGLAYAYQTYNYYDDGTLKEIIPHQFHDRYLDYDFYGKMEFNESGELAKAIFLTTPNPFLGESKVGFRSVCTFSYADNGLCTKKDETLYPKKANRDIDSICCHNIYEYNDKGDVIRWEYSDTIYQSSTSKNANYLSFLFNYKYDRQDNWTTMKIVLPDCYLDNRKALADIAMQQEMLGLLNMGVKQLNEPVTITVERQINYHALPVSQPKVSPSQEETKPDVPKFTAAQGHGLYGKVKSVSDGEYTIHFNEYGNITNEVWKDGGNNDYNYESPTKYMIGTVIGPFRITCAGNTRKEEDEKEIELSVEYEFDTQGRVICYKYAQGMARTTEKYTYSGNQKCPDTQLKEEGDEEGNYISTFKYIYLEFDKEGNWIKRKVNRTCENTEYLYDGGKETQKTSIKVEPEFIEHRTISYY